MIVKLTEEQQKLIDDAYAKTKRCGMCRREISTLSRGLVSQPWSYRDQRTGTMNVYVLCGGCFKALEREIEKRRRVARQQPTAARETSKWKSGNT